MNKQKSVSSPGRGTASVILALSFLVLPFSGIALHAAGEGGPGAFLHAITGVHVVAGLVCTLAAVVHIKHNWKVLKNHIAKNSGKSVAALLAMAVLMVLAFIH